MNEQEKQERAEKIGLFRFGIISPVLHAGEESQNHYFKRISEKEFLVPGVGMKKFSVSTFKSWLYNYRAYGYDTIKPRIRRDKGTSRKISPVFKDLVIKTLKELPITTYAMLYNYLIREGLLLPQEFTMPTFIKYLKDNNISIKNREIIPRKKFETEHINQLWVCDFMHSMHIRNGKSKKKAYLCAIIDDHSRVITGFLWSFDSNLSTLEEAFKGAILTYGLPEKFYCDNAKVFLSEAIHRPCAKLGIALIHSKPYDPSSRGKIERFFRTVRENFIPLLDKEKMNLSELNSSFSNWLNKEYHKRIHEGIGEPPIDRYLREVQKTTPKRINPDSLDLVFYRTIKRTVKNDCTISVDGKLYEVPSRYTGLKIEIRYSSSSPDELFIFENNSLSVRLRPLDLHQNANPPHISLSYSTLFSKQE
jgi:transposase InsO family protein